MSGRSISTAYPRASLLQLEPVENGARDRFARAAQVIPEGLWTAYGEIGLAAAGTRGAARAVGRAASRNPAFPNAWRVIHADGSIPTGWGVRSGGPARCRQLLEAEGVTFANG